MQIDLEAAADVAEIDAELNDQRTDTETDNDPVVAANDNGLHWPLIAFPEGWYASS